MAWWMWQQLCQRNNAQDVIKQRAISSILTLTLERIHCVFHKFTLTDRVKDMRIWHPVWGEFGLGNLDRTSKWGDGEQHRTAVKTAIPLDVKGALCNISCLKCPFSNPHMFKQFPDWLNEPFFHHCDCLYNPVH